MPIVALTCPQCGGPLPRAALWRMVACPHCNAVVTRASEVVERATFRQALVRSNAGGEAGRRMLRAGGATYAVIGPLGEGAASTVFLAERIGPLKALVTLKVARDRAGALALAAEARHLDALQALDAPGAAYFAMRLPRRIHDGAATDEGGQPCHVLVLRHDAAAWGSLAALQALQPAGIDARHAVWIWRRGLETLGFLHGAGWSHGDVGLDHLLVLPAEHGVQLIGWALAGARAGAELTRARARDLLQLAWSVRSLLHGTSAGIPGIPTSTPAPLAALLRRATEDAGWQRDTPAGAVEAALVQAAQASFGSPRFLPFDPGAPGGVAASA